jgi:hypothetical protein
MEMRSSSARSMALELNGGEGGGPAAQGAALSIGESPGLAHEDGKWVRWLGTDGVAETEVRHGGGGLPEADKRCWCRRNATVGVSSYRCEHCE